MANQGNLFFSKISHSGNNISVLYNLRVNDRLYNLQSGFEESYGKRVSLGLLHLGLAIEESCKDESIKTFDMLAGPGKNKYYKSDFSQSGTNLITLQFNRSRRLKIIYTLYDKMPRALKRILGRILKNTR